MDELEKRIQQYNTMSLPGQPMGLHMGTSYLINDLWREVQRLRAQADFAHTCGECGSTLELVRPGKYQCNHCDANDTQAVG